VINFYDYLLFVSFFPQLIAGPIVSHKDFFPQIKKIKFWTIKSYHFNLGFFLFSLGLFKKSVLIDPYTSYIDVLFAHAANGISLSFIDAWTAALGYSFQIYFDFSGYSDMALGLALIFGIRLPYNFFSPYKSTSIQEFWRRWHITLSTFLRDYLYIPLGGNKHGKIRTLLALLITMFLGGLWHGAGWTFIIWGLFHGSLLIIYYWWVILTKPIKILINFRNTVTYKASSILVTFLLVSVGWVFFRASDLPTAFSIINGMIGLNSTQQITELTKGIVLAFPVYFIIIWALPNSIEIMKKYNVSSSKQKFNTQKLSIYKNILCFRMTPIWGFISIGLFIVSWFSLSSLSPFIYFQF
jgi:D-alanyl-lipoteichoic acid acyltransferase DltB (MBOAT superfamily)